MRHRLLPILAAILPLVATAADPNSGIPEDCPELRVNPVSIPDDQNAYAILAKLPTNPKSTVEKPDSFYDLDLFWKLHAKTEKPTGIIIGKAKVLLARHAEKLRLWDAALAAPHFVEPSVNNFSETETGLIPNFGTFREAVLGNIWRIRTATHDGRHADAFNDWMRLRTALLRQSEKSATLVTGMVRSVGVNLVNKEAWLLHPSPTDARRCRPQPIKFPFSTYQSISRGESRFGVVTVPKTDSEIEKLLHWPLTKFEETGINTVADYRAKVLPLFGDISIRARETRDEIRRLEADGLINPIVFKQRLTADSPWNRRSKATVFFESGIINIFDFAYFATWADAISCTHADLAIALRAYAGEHEGKLPLTLDALVPVYADAVPTDPFDGKPMRYDPKTPKLWSIGPDCTDEQGALVGTPPRRSDMTGDITSYPPNIVPAFQNSAGKTSK
jgi:hypothetical protein